MSGKIEELLNRARLDEDHSSINSVEKNFVDAAEAGFVYSILKAKLLDIAEWNDHGFISSYELFDENGRALENENLSVGTFIRILLKGSGKYDWVKVVNIEEPADEFIITVKPAFDPTAEERDESAISHFFTGESTNNFCIRQAGEKVSLYVIGLDEKQNTGETENALQTIRNAAVNLGSYLGIQSGEWQAFCKGLLECAADDARRIS